MITQEHEYYIRFLLLLLQVGSDLLREIAEKSLQRKGQALCQFLNSVEPALLNDKHLTQMQKDTLYPPNPQVASLNHFDITLISHLLINYLNGYIDNNERKGINDIRQLRNSHHAHATEGKMDIVTFTREWNCLATIISYAGNGLSPEVQQRHIDLTASIEKGQLDITAVAEQIKKLDQSTVFFENIQTCLDDMNRVQEQLVESVENVRIIAKKTEVEVYNVKTLVQNTGATVDALKEVAQHTDGAVAGVHNDVLEMKAMLYKIKERTENQGRITKVVHTVYGIVYLSADEQETVDEAEAVLLEASNNSIAKKEPTDLSHRALHDKVTQVLEDIENLDVQVVDVRKGSIVFGFKCFSLKAILDLIDYFYGSRFQRRLGEIANALEEIIGKKVCIAAAKIDKQSIQGVITKMESKEYEKVVQFELSCTGVDGLLHALQAFEEGYAANSVNDLSKALSESIGKPITLHISIDMGQMRYAIKSIQDQLDLELGVKERECQYEIEKQRGTWYSNEQSPRTNVSSLHRFDCFSLVYQEEIHVLCESDPYTVIYSCAILSDERLMMADSKGLSVVNTHTGRVEQKKTLDTRYSDIAVLPKDQVAVTLPCDGKLVILSTNDMSLIRTIPNEFRPTGITFYQDELYLVCFPNDKSHCVNILNLRGVILREIECDEQLSCDNAKIAVSKDTQHLYKTGYKSLIRYSNHGQVTARYCFAGTNPKALTLLDDGSLLVVAGISGRMHGNHSIHHISADLQQGYELKLDERSVRFIGVDPVNNRIYVIAKGTIKVYYMQKQDVALSSSKTDEKLTSLKAEKKLSSSKTDEKITSLKAVKKLSSKTDEQSTSLKAEKKLSSSKTYEKITSLKAENKLSSKTDEKLTSFKAEKKLSSSKTDEQLDIYKPESEVFNVRMGYSRFRYDEKLPFPERDAELSSLKTDEKKFVPCQSVEKGTNVKQKTCQLM